MQISTSTASHIIKEINKIIPYKINIMNHTGLIIASSDFNRVNQIHYGARYLIEHKLNELQVHGSEEYDGGKPGANFPIIVRDTIVGVIGVTGVYEEICPYAQIIKRMTEILLLNDILRCEQIKQTYRVNNFLYEWIHAKSILQEKELQEKGSLLGVDISAKRRFIYMKPKESTSEEIIHKVEQYLRENRFGDHEFFVLPVANSFFIGVRDCSDKELMQWLKGIEKEVVNILSAPIYIGVNAKRNKQEAVYEYYSQTRRAMKACISQNETILFYKDILVDLFMDEVSEKTKQEFIMKVFKNFKVQEIKETIILLECYYHYNGSIQKASKALYLHKNTLQNRLNRIKERTGFDPRALQDIPLFSIAIHFYQYQESQL